MARTTSCHADCPYLYSPEQSSCLGLLLNTQVIYVFHPLCVHTYVVCCLSFVSEKKKIYKNGQQFNHLHIFPNIVYPGQMNSNVQSDLNVQWRSCVCIIYLREKIATPPTDYEDSIITLHILLCRMDSGMTVS